MPTTTLTKNAVDREIINLEGKIRYYKSIIDKFTQFKQTYVTKINNLISTGVARGANAKWVERMQEYKNKIILRFDLYINKIQEKIDLITQRIIQLKKLVVESPVSTVTVKEIVDVTKIVHNSMMTYLKNTWKSFDDNPDNFIIPFVPKNYNLRLEALPGILVSPPEPDNWNYCEVTLGTSKVGSKWYYNTYLELYGYFTAKNTQGVNGQLLKFGSDNANLVSSGGFLLKQVFIPSAGILTNDEQTINTNLSPTQSPSALYSILGNVLDRTAINAIVHLVNSLNLWAKNTAFLVPPPVCAERFYFDRYGWPINKPSTTAVSGPNIGTPCSMVIEPVCDIITDITYTNTCQANKANALYLEDGECQFMVYARSRGNLAVPQNPTEALDDNGAALLDTKGQKITLPNILQAEYFSRLYYFLLASYKNKKVSSISQLSAWATNHLQNYTPALW